MSNLPSLVKQVKRVKWFNNGELFLPRFGNDLSEDPHSVVIAHILKVHIINLDITTQNTYLFNDIKIHTVCLKYYFKSV